MEFITYIFDETKSHIRSFIDLNNNTWFIARDIAELLEYKNARNAINEHVRPQNKMTLFQLLKTNNGLHLNKNIDLRFMVINESGLYDLIYSSYKYEALQFKYWLSDTIIPNLRKKEEYRLKTEISEKNIVIKEKTDKIDELMNKIDNMRIDNNIKFEQIITQNKRLEDKINIIKEHVVDHTINPKLLDHFLIVRLYDTCNYKYYMIRAQQRYVKPALKVLKKRYRIKSISERIIKHITYMPNSIMFSNKVREVLNKTYIIIKYNHFNIINGHFENEIIKIIDNINESCRL